MIVFIQSVVNLDLIRLAFILFEVFNMLRLSPLTPDEVAALLLLIIISDIGSELFLASSSPPDSSLYDLSNQVVVIAFPNIEADIALANHRLNITILLVKNLV